MLKIRLLLIKLIMPKLFKEILIDTVFSQMNDDVELLARLLLRMGFITKNKEGFYEYEEDEE